MFWVAFAICLIDLIVQIFAAAKNKRAVSKSGIIAPAILSIIFGGLLGIVPASCSSWPTGANSKYRIKLSQIIRKGPQKGLFFMSFFKRMSFYPIMLMASEKPETAGI